MKVVAKPIEVVAWFDLEGSPSPVRFRMLGEDASYTTIKVNKILKRDFEKMAGNKMLIFRCQSIVNETERVYEIKYEIDTCKWMLFKV